MTPGNTIGFIPAYNEAPAREATYLDRVLACFDAARRSGLLREVLCVDDGSRDYTADIVREFPSIQVVSHRDERGLPRKRGKAAAFVTAANYAASRSADFLLACDADMLNLAPEHLRFLLTALGDMQVSMVSAGYQQLESGTIASGKCVECDAEVAGLRAVRMTALQPLLEQDHQDHARWIKYFSGPGFALEPALEWLIPAELKRHHFFDYLYSRAPAGRTDANREIVSGFDYAYGLIEMEKRQLRAQRQEAHQQK